MVSLHKLISFCILVFLIKPTASQQSYDESNCTAESQVVGSKYLCNPKNLRCKAYITYRAQKDFQSMTSISSLFNINTHKLLKLNHMTEANSSNLMLRGEIIVPVKCSCSSTFSHSIFLYNFSSTDSFVSVACGVFEGLLKGQSLKEENPALERSVPGDFMIKVPIRCACPDSNQRRNGVKYLVTYPVIESDHTDLIARKFGVPEETIWNANKLQPFPTMFPLTTLLVPTKDVPLLNLDVENLPSSPRLATPIRKIEPTNKKSKHFGSYIFLGLGGLLAVILLLIAAILAFRSIRKSCHHPMSFQLLPARISVSSNVSPDFLDRMSKLKQSLTIFSFDELRNATDDFNEGSMIDKAVYRGKIGGSSVAIKQMNTKEAARRVIYILTKISHINIVKLEGCCYGTDPYLVFEFAEYGSLRDCLSSAIFARQLTWLKRTQIAFDLAVGLHYIHHCTKPSFIHHNIHSRNVLITNNWRAKLTGFSSAKPVICSEEIGGTSFNESIIVGRKGHLAPEYLTYGLASLKVDVFAFGVVLLELLSAKEAAADGKLLKDSVNIFGDVGLECSSGCLDKLKEFMDPNLEGDYPMADAMSLVFLAKACLEKDPHQRPTVDNVLEALSKFV